jgi:DNA helicase-2/ATP-dependent DNA helicase PcrA
VDKIKGNKELNGIAIIYRNNISAIPFAERLNSEGIPFYIKDEIGSFFNHWVISDILKFFEFAENQWNTEIFSSLYYKMKSYVNKKDVDTLYYDLSTFDKAGKSVFDRLMEFPGYENKKKQLTDFKYKFEFVSKMTPQKAIAYIEKDLNYRAYLENFAEKYNYTMESLDNVLSSLKLIAYGLETLSQFKTKLSMLQQEMSASKSNKYKNAITLTTSHSSKGLEWDEVFFIDTQNIPSLDSIKKADKDNTSDYYEEARVFFVSITRARKLLHVIYPKYRNGSRVEASPFYNQLFNIVNPPEVKSAVPVKNKFIIPLPKLEEGFIINHNLFGDGKVLNVDGDILTIDFNNTGIKKLSLEICKRTGILKLIS